MFQSDGGLGLNEENQHLDSIYANSLTASGMASYYDDLWDRVGNNIGGQMQRRINFIVQSLNDFVGCSNLKILDLGCGFGWMAPFLSPFGSVTGIDFTPKSIEFAARAFRKYGNFLLAKPGLARLGIPEHEVFDVVVCSEVIEHVEHPLALLMQISSFLKTKGCCMLTTPNGNVWSQFHQDKRTKDQLQPVENWLTPRQCAYLLSKSGFRVLRHEGAVCQHYRLGAFGWFQHRNVGRIFERLRLSRLYARLVLPMALYQMMVARKMTEF
jgi:SAM-dependent methyltransferase